MSKSKTLRMFINATGFCVSEERIDNRHFLKLSGSTSERIEQRTSTHTRSKAKEEEDVNTMNLEAVKDALPKLPYDITEVDLIVSAPYSLYDMIATAVHTVQHECTIADAKTLYLSSACSSFLNALEVVEGYFAMGEASKVLMPSADKSSIYCNETDPKANHLWDNAAAAFFISKERIGEDDAEIVEVYTRDLGHSSKAMGVVHLRPCDGDILMPEEHDIFIQACTYMSKNVLHLLEKNGCTLDSLTYFIDHQANMRIMANVAEQLNLPDRKFLHNIEELGNTGSVSSVLVYTQNDKNFKKGDLIAITIFGGDYSAGTCLIKR